MKIAHIHWSLAIGGTETMLVDIINEQVKTNDVTLIIINKFVNDKILKKINPKCKLLFCKRALKSRNIFPFIKLNYYLWKFHPDIIHIHANRIVSFVFARGIKVRTIHSTLNLSKEYNQFKALYSISDAVKKYTLKQGFESITIANGIQIGAICNNRNAKAQHTYKIIQVSRLAHEYKGQDILIKALSILYNKGISNFEMYFIGDGKSLTYLKSLVQQFQLSSLVHFEGNKDRIYIYENLCKFDLFVQPSLSEGFGLTIAEAMAAKIPILVSDIDGPMEVIDHGRLGMYFKAGDANDLANQLELVLNGKYNYGLIDFAYNFVEENYNINITANNYIKEYHNLLGNE